MPFVIALGVVGVALGGTAILLLKEVRVTAKEAPGAIAGFGLTGLAVAGTAAYFFFKR